MLSFTEYLKRDHYEWYVRTFAKSVDVVVVSSDTSQDIQVLEEGKWVAGHFEREIRIDRNTHLRSNEKQAHFHDRKGNELYAVTQNGKPSHGSKPFKLSSTQADILRGQGFNIPKSRIVEAVLVAKGPKLLLN